MNKISGVVVNINLEVPTVKVKLTFPISVQVSAVIIELQDEQVIKDLETL